MISSHDERSSLTGGKGGDSTFDSHSTPSHRPSGRSTSHATHDMCFDKIHRLSAVYTNPTIVERMLDEIGWREDVDLSGSRLLEPAAGNGQFLVAAARRLASSYSRHGIPHTIRTLSKCIAGFELHPQAADEARSRVITELREGGVNQSTARACGTAWIHQEDFLLATLRSRTFTHVVGNPPYLRWSKIPIALRRTYEMHLTPEVAKGDLFLPFLDKALEYMDSDGTCAILCSDRWQFMAYAQDFREKWLPRLKIHSNQSILATDAFIGHVDTYPTILVAQKQTTPNTVRPMSNHPTGKTLEELSFTIRVGPALGFTQAFVLRPEEQCVEPELLNPWVDSTEILEGSVEWKGRRVITMFTDEGELLDIRRFPKLEKHLSTYRPELVNRRIVRDGAPWYRPIERVRAREWSGPKLLIPELVKVPRLALDRSGLIPSHGVYAILPLENADIEDLYKRLSNGGLASALLGIAPKVKNGYVRCYRHFLRKIRV